MWCDLKYSPTHRCVRSQLYQIFMEDLKGNTDEPEVFSKCVDSLEELAVKGEEVTTLHTISLQALWGTENYNTMRMQGRIKN